MLEKILNLYYTVKDLKWIQIRYQLAYRLFKRKYKYVNYKGDISLLEFTFYVRPAQSFFDDLRFTFLNQMHSFKNKIDWDFDGFGKLWTYNLNYFDFLNQKELSQEMGVKLIKSFIGDPPKYLDPYPTSLRLMNWMKFASRHKINDGLVNDSIYSQTLHLTKKLEYHLMGNHLLENGFALLFAGFYFNNGQFFKKAEDILHSQMKEQILNDGGHFELSPMYHCIIFYRVLEAIDLIRNNKIDFSSIKLLSILEQKAKGMLSWLNEITYEDGTYPMFNDSTFNIALDVKSLFQYAKVLSINSVEKILSDSGYRKIKNSNYELFFDVGKIGPHYIPGHAHSDSLAILMHVDGKPLLVDRGISTYEKNHTRQEERKTSSHNTIEVNSQEQSAIWSGFRVGRKANILELIEKDNIISASHDGYSSIGALHKRTIHYADKSILVVDHVSKNYRCVATFHFHPEVKIWKDGALFRTNDCIISFENADTTELLEYSYSEGFNKVREAIKLNISFSLKLTTKITIK